MRRGFALAAARRAGAAREPAVSGASRSGAEPAFGGAVPSGSRAKGALAPAYAEPAAAPAPPAKPWAPSGAFGVTAVPHAVRTPVADASGWRNVDGERVEDGRYAAFQRDVAAFVPAERLVTDSVRRVLRPLSPAAARRRAAPRPPPPLCCRAAGAATRVRPGDATPAGGRPRAGLWRGVCADARSHALARP